MLTSDSKLYAPVDFASFFQSKAPVYLLMDRFAPHQHILLILAWRVDTIDVHVDWAKIVPLEHT
jgi:hypothetical protein